MPVGATLILRIQNGDIVTIPDQILSSQWTLTDNPSAGGDKLLVDIDVEPDNGGSDILRYEASVNGGAAVDLGGGLGPRNVTVPVGVSASVRVRAVNVANADPLNWSNPKTATPSVYVDGGSGSGGTGVYDADSNGAGLARSTTMSGTVILDSELSVILTSARKVGHFGNLGNGGIGDIWILDEGSGVPISAHTPAWNTNIDGAGASGNGAMLNISGSDSAGPSDVPKTQGFDTRTGGQGLSYSATRRWVPPGTLVAGDTLVIAKSLTHNNTKNKIKRFGVVTIVGTIPYADEFRPPVVWRSTLGARPRKRFSDVNMALLPSLPHTQTPPSINHSQLGRWSGDFIRASSRIGTSGSPDHAHVYGREFTETIDDECAYVCSSATTGEKTASVKYIVQRGIDAAGIYRSRGSFSDGVYFGHHDGAHHGGRQLSILTAGKLLNDSAMITAGRMRPLTPNYGNWHEVGEFCYISAPMIAATNVVGWNGGGEGGNYPYPVGMPTSPQVPEWCGKYSGTSYTQVNHHWAPGAKFYRTTGGCDGIFGEYLLAAALGLHAAPGATLPARPSTSSAQGWPALWDYVWRHHQIRFTGIDVWNKAGGSTNRYTDMVGMPGGSALTAYMATMFNAYYRNFWQRPW